MGWIDRVVAGTVAGGAMAVVGGFSSLAFANETPAAPAAAVPGPEAPAAPAPRAVLLGVPDVAWADAMAPATTLEAEPAAAWRWATTHTVPVAG